MRRTRSNARCLPQALLRAELFLETASDDGRFTDTIEGLVVKARRHCTAGSCLEGRHFGLEFGTNPDPIQDARLFVCRRACVTREVSPHPRVGHRQQLT